MAKAIIINGEFNSIIARKKSNEFSEIGELLVSENGDERYILQVYNLAYGSQISKLNLELISGMNLEEDTNLELHDRNIRTYTLLYLKNLLRINNGKASLSKSIPKFLSELRDIKKDDLSFLQKEDMYFGKLRSGSRIIDIDVSLDSKKVLPHHILVAATTGRGKSNLTSTILYNMLPNKNAGFLVLDPHDEYYGKNGIGLKDSPYKENLVYYSPKDVPRGEKTLRINLSKIRPSHFNGVVEWSVPQKDMIIAYYKEKKSRWIEAIILQEPISMSSSINENTFNVVRRRLMTLLDIGVVENDISCRGIFINEGGENTLDDILRELEEGKIVIVDTSSYSGTVELLIGSMLANKIFARYKNYKKEGTLRNKPVISIVLEEAPRVLGKEVLEKGSNVFASIAREGRKFKIGLFAITQLPSLIPREILANMNTKIILGIEMAPERESIINSAAQDLSDYSRAIASLDKGEAIITSNFTIFPIPVKIPLFSSVVKEKEKINFEGI